MIELFLMPIELLHQSKSHHFYQVMKTVMIGQTVSARFQDTFDKIAERVLGSYEISPRYLAAWIIPVVSCHHISPYPRRVAHILQC
jgi:hypothetical protein